MRKWQNVLILRWIRCFVQTRVLCLKSLKTGEPSAKMTKRADLAGWKRCFGQTRALCWKSLEIGAPSAKMTKRADLALETQFCTNSCTLLKITKKWCIQFENDETCWSRWLKTLFCTKLCTLLKTAIKWCARCKSEKNVLISGWKRCLLQTRALC